MLFAKAMATRPELLRRAQFWLVPRHPQRFDEVAKLTDLWLNPKQGTDAALAQAFAHVIFKEFHLEKPSEYFRDYAKRYTDLPVLVLLNEKDGSQRAERFLRASDLAGNLGQENNPEWKTIAVDSQRKRRSWHGLMSRMFRSPAMISPAVGSIRRLM